MENTEIVTLITAIWGAITGTIALLLRARDSSKDRPILIVKPEFEFTNDFDYPPSSVALNLTVTNIGHRPTTLDQVIAIYRAPHISKILSWLRDRQRTMYLSHYRDRQSSQTVEPGKHVELRFGNSRLTPSDQHDPIQLNRIIVIDKAGRIWKSPRKFGQRILQIQRSAKLIQTTDLETEAPKKSYSIRIYHIDKAYSLRVRWLINNKYSYHWATFRRLNEAEAEYSKNLAWGNDFINGKLETPLSE